MECGGIVWGRRKTMFIPTSGNFEKMLEDPKAFYDRSEKIDHIVQGVVLFIAVLAVLFAVHVLSSTGIQATQTSMQKLMQPELLELSRN